MFRVMLVTSCVAGLLACAPAQAPQPRGERPASAGANASGPAVLQTAPAPSSSAVRAPVAIDQTTGLTPAELAQLTAGGAVIRHYGNQGIQRQLWGFAIDIQASGGYTRDPSHPAFCLPEQEPGAGNHRAFAALDPCKGDGESCTSGIDCCAGACGDGKCAPAQGCAARDERCAHDSDCCASAAGEPPSWCIAGFCAFVPLN